MLPEREIEKAHHAGEHRDAPAGDTEDHPEDEQAGEKRLHVLLGCLDEALDRLARFQVLGW